MNKKLRMSSSLICQLMTDPTRPGRGINTHRSRCTIITYCALASLSALTVGCGGSDLVVVKGRVTYLGEPLERAQIRFVPQDSSTTWMSGAYIVDGEYEVVNKGGVPVGKYNIEIVAHRPTADYLRLNGPPGPGANWDHIPREQFLPAKYNTETELQLTIDSGSSEVVKNIELTD